MFGPFRAPEIIDGSDGRAHEILYIQTQGPTMYSCRGGKYL